MLDSATDQHSVDLYPSYTCSFQSMDHRDELPTRFADGSIRRTVEQAAHAS